MTPSLSLSLEEYIAAIGEESFLDNLTNDLPTSILLNTASSITALPSTLTLLNEPNSIKLASSPIPDNFHFFLPVTPPYSQHSDTSPLSPMSHHRNFFTPEAEQAAKGDPDAFYLASHQGFTSQAPGYAAQATYQTIEHQTIASLPYSTGGYVPPEPAYSPPQPHDWRPFPLYSQRSPTTAYSTSPPTTNFQPYDYIEGHLQVPESGQPTSGSSRSGSPNSTDLHNYGYPNNNGTWTCKYPGCSSKSVFSRGCDLRKHFNRHTKSLFCRHEGCPQATEGGFSSKKDRARHEAKHNPGIVCEWDGCNRVFSRMDNMKDHVRRIHRRSIGS